LSFKFFISPGENGSSRGTGEGQGSPQKREKKKQQSQPWAPPPQSFGSLTSWPHANQAIIPQMPTTTITMCTRLVTACLSTGDQRKHPMYLLIVLPRGPHTIRSQDLDWHSKRGRLKWCHQHPEAVDISQRLLLNKSTHLYLICYIVGCLVLVQASHTLVFLGTLV